MYYFSIIDIIYLITHIYWDFITATIVCIQSDIFKWLQRDSNHKHLVRKRTLNHLVKLACLASDMTPASNKEFLDIQANYTVQIHSKPRTWHDNNIQSDIFYQSFLLKVNEFIIQYFRSLLCFAGPLSESEFLIVFSFSFPVIYQ